MTVEEMRTAIIDVYSGPTWRLRVLGMEDRQVIAIYKHMKQEGTFERVRLERRKREKMQEKSAFPSENAQQITIWDILKEQKDK